MALRNVRGRDLFDRIDRYIEVRDVSEREAVRDITLLDTFSADALVNRSRGSFDASAIPKLPPLPGKMYDFMFYFLLHPEASVSELSVELGIGHTTVRRWRSDPRVLAHLAQMQSEVRSLNLAQVSLLERDAREKAREILNMRPTSVTIEEQGRLIRFILDLTAKMRGLQDSPLVSVNVGASIGAGIHYRPDQGTVDEVLDLAEELKARRRLSMKLKLEAEDVGPAGE